MAITSRRYDINQCALYKCKSKKRLALLLKVQYAELKQVNDNLQYHLFEINKSNSTEKRLITAPHEHLKSIQSRILSLLTYVLRPSWLNSGERGKSYINNGKDHINANYVLTIDIKNFYDNCKRNYIYLFFLEKLKTAPDIAELLTNIVTYNGLIPTGSPTSQLISFYAYMDMFMEINSTATVMGCKFTLYVDDMTFSSQTPFNHKILSNNIDIILRKYGHKPKYKKIKYYSKDKPKPITGTIVTQQHKLKVPNKLQNKIYINFQKIKPSSTTKLSSSETKKALQTLKGQIQAAKNIDKNIFQEINRIAAIL